MWIKYKAFGEEYAKALARFNEVYDKYLKKFGKNSLDRVLLSEPLMSEPKKLIFWEVAEDDEWIRKNVRRIR